MKNLLFTVCGRGGSKGVKNKNIRPFLGMPLFKYTLAAIKVFKEHYSEFNCFTVVSTDSQEFKDLLREMQGDIFLVNRAENLAEDTTPKMYVISDALLKSEEYFGIKFDAVVDLDITSPIRTPEDIYQCIEKLKDEIEVVFSVTHARRNPYFNMVCRKDDKIQKVLDSNFTARQQAPQMYDMNASIYAYAREALLRQIKTPLNLRCDIVEMPDTGIVDIDNEGDFELMELLFTYFAEKNEKVKEIMNNAELMTH